MSIVKQLFKIVCEQGRQKNMWFFETNKKPFIKKLYR